jgi:hypothetical protein
VGRGEHEVGVEEGAAAEAAVHDQHLPRVRVGWILDSAANNATGF